MAVLGGWAARVMAAGPCHKGVHSVCIYRVISICILLIVMNIQKLIYIYICMLSLSEDISLLSPPISVFSYSFFAFKICGIKKVILILVGALFSPS
jgi:hypothetical protein